MTYLLTDNDCVRLGVSWTGDGTYGSGTCGGTCLLGLLAFGFCGGGCGDMFFACLIQSSSSYIKTWLLGVYIMWIYVYLFVITIPHQWNLANAEVCEATFDLYLHEVGSSFFSSFDATHELQRLPHMAPTSTKEVRINILLYYQIVAYLGFFLP